MKKIIIVFLMLTIFNTDPTMAMNTDYSYEKFDLGTNAPETSYLPNSAGIVPQSTISLQSLKNRNVRQIGRIDGCDKLRISGIGYYVQNSYERGSFDEYRLNSNYYSNIYYNPQGSRMDGFDEFKYVGE